MNNHPSTDNYNQTLPFSTFGSDASVLKMSVLRLSSENLRQVASSPRMAHREAAADPIVELRVVSRYHVDIYGRPRILSKLEVTLYAPARPVAIGVVIGFGLAITLLAIHNPSTFNPHKTTGQPPVTSLETEP
jgi:hypothetical protein